jgi:hypothetical protein
VATAVVSYLANLYPQTLDHLTDGNGPPFGDVFVNSWSAAYLTLHRRFAEIYDVNAFYAFEQSVVRPAVSGLSLQLPVRYAADIRTALAHPLLASAVRVADDELVHVLPRAEGHLAGR